MDIKTNFNTQQMNVSSQLSQTKESSPDRDPQQGGFYTSYKNNEEQYESKAEIDDTETNAEKPFESKSNENNLDVSKLLESIKLQRSLSLNSK